MILAGDIGGTSTRLACFEVVRGQLNVIVEQVYRSAAHAGLEQIVARFTSEHAVTTRAATFGIAGPVRNGQVRTPNLSWVVDASILALQLGLGSVGLINDLEANAWGIDALGDHDLATLNPGAPDATGNRAIVSAGTGLGEAGMYWDGTRHRPFACEGGHSDFAPRNEAEMALLRTLLTRMDRVSYERVLSGPGLFEIYQCLKGALPDNHDDALAGLLDAADRSAVISRAGLDGSSRLAIQALDMFVSLYGAEAGNVALTLMATGGVYIGGGIAPRLMDKLVEGSFMDAFVAKGRMRPLMESMPVRVILNDKTALLGAARHAAVQAALLQ